MDGELRKMLGNIEQSIAIDQKGLTRLQAFDAQVTADLGAGLDSAAINRKIQARRNDFQLDSNWPTLSSVAWDVAVADQSAGWIDAGALQRYSAAYNAERELATWLQHDSTLVLNPPHLVDTLTDLQTGHAVDPHDFQHSLRQMEMMLGSMVSHLHYAAARITPALHGATADKPVD